MSSRLSPESIECPDVPEDWVQCCKPFFAIIQCHTVSRLPLMGLGDMIYQHFHVQLNGTTF